MSNIASMQITDQDTRSAVPNKGGARLGQVVSTADGRTYRYSLAGAVNLAAGKLVTAPAVVANHINRTGVTAAAGVSSLTFTVGNTATTADQYADGYLVVNAGTGVGQALLVAGNTAVSGNGSPTVTLAESLFTATLAADSKFSLYTNPYANVIISASAVALQAVGVPNIAVTAANYFWAQISGYCSLLSDGIISKAAGAIISDAVNGAVEIEVSGTLTQRVATAIEATVDTEYRPMNLQMQ